MKRLKLGIKICFSSSLKFSTGNKCIHLSFWRHPVALPTGHFGLGFDHQGLSFSSSPQNPTQSPSWKARLSTLLWSGALAAFLLENRIAECRFTRNGCSRTISKGFSIPTSGSSFQHPAAPPSSYTSSGGKQGVPKAAFPKW